MSKIVMMFGCWSDDASWASWMKRRRRSVLATQLGRQELQGHEPVQALIASLVHLAHATDAEQRADLIGSEASTRIERHDGGVTFYSPGFSAHQSIPSPGHAAHVSGSSGIHSGAMRRVTDSSRRATIGDCIAAAVAAGGVRRQRSSRTKRRVLVVNVADVNHPTSGPAGVAAIESLPRRTTTTSMNAPTTACSPTSTSPRMTRWCG